MCVDDGDDDSKTDDWVLFADVSAALSIKTADALVKLLNDENAVKAVPADRFKERVVPRNILGRQPVTNIPAHKPSTAVHKSSTAANKPFVAVAEQQSHVKDTTSSATDNTDAATTKSASSAGEQILLVRYDQKLKQLLGVDAYTLS